MKKTKIKAESNSIIIEPKEMAEDAGLVYVNDQKPGLKRESKGSHFVYIGLDHKAIKDKKTIKRIQALAIPPAYTDVWICPLPNGHLQATGRDAKGRKQYRYHTQWRAISDETKYHKMIAFAQALPKIRRRIHQDLALPGIRKEKILATVVYLLEVTLIRVGNEAYAKENKSFGLTTLQNRHVEIEGAKIFFKFRGKSGQSHAISLKNSRLAKIVKKCRDLPGQDLFEYLDEENNPVPLNSTEVNGYLKSITEDHFTAKDFRTWAGTVLAILALQEFQEFDTDVQAKKNIVQAVEKVAKKLGNTPSICRKCYVHPEVFNAYLEGSLLKAIKRHAEQELINTLHDLTQEEAAALFFLQQRLKLKIERKES